MGRRSMDSRTCGSSPFLGAGLAMALAAAALVVSLIALAVALRTPSAPPAAAVVVETAPVTAALPAHAVAPAPAAAAGVEVREAEPVAAAAVPSSLSSPSLVSGTPEPEPESKPEPVALTGAGLFTPAGRSAIPQPGEVLDKPIAAGVLGGSGNGGAIPAVPTTSVAGGVISWNEAGQHVGQEITVEGRIADAHNTGSVCFLNFTTQRSAGTFYLIVFRDVLGAWPQPPETYFLNRKVRATGKVYLHKDRPQIRIEDAGQLQLVE